MLFPIFQLPLNLSFTSSLVSSCRNLFNYQYRTIMFQPAKITPQPKILLKPFLIWPVEYSHRFLCERLLQRNSPQSSVRRTMAGKNGAHFAHHSSRTTRSLPREYFGIDHFQSSGGWGKESFAFG